MPSSATVRTYLYVILYAVIISCFVSYKMLIRTHDKPNSAIKPEALSSPRDIFSEVLQITKCHERHQEPQIQQRGEFWVLYNFVKAEEIFLCHESITYVTQADFTFLDNLVPIVERWKGPVSVALYAPGYDFHTLLKSIAYLRQCKTSLIKKYVSFHLYFESAHLPNKNIKFEKNSVYDTWSSVAEDDYDCNKPGPYHTVTMTYKTSRNLTYPINVGRNVAREGASTHFIFSSDVELYPSPNFIQTFMEFVANNKKLLAKQIRQIFILPLFEILATESVPDNKTSLQTMAKKGKAFLFHRNICPQCHRVHQMDEWLKAKETTGLNVFFTGKRLGKFAHLEAFYVGTHEEPLYEERMTWEGQRNKITQAYLLCVLDYDYIILDNAFLIHKPGIKKFKTQIKKHSILVSKTNTFVNYKLKKEFDYIYGQRNGCQF